MSHTPKQQSGSRAYREAWRAVNLLIRSDGSWSGRERDVCYRNEGDGRFTDTSFLTGLDSAGDGRAFVTLDADGDGALDLVLVSRTAPRLRLLRNQSAATALMLELRGSREPEAIGARVELETDRRTLTRFVEANGGYLSQSSRRLHFALAAGEVVKSVVITWPDGAREVLPDAIPARGLFRLRQGGGKLEAFTARGTVASARAPLPAAPPSTWMREPVPAPAIDGFKPGRKTVLAFWASWCPPCGEELREWTSAAARFVQAGVQVVLVPVDDERKPSSPFALARPTSTQIAAWNIFHQHLFDRRRDLALPTSFLLDEKGSVLNVYHGVTPSARILADVAARARPGLPFAGRWFGPEPKRNYGDLAASLAEHGLARESLQYFERAEASAEVSNNFAGALLEAGEPRRAEELWTRVLEQDPRQTEAWVNLGLARLRREEWRTAAQAFEKAVALTPDEAAAQDGWGTALFAQSDAAGAERHFAEAVRIDGDNGGFRFNYGSALAAQGKLNEALREFEQARRQMPDSTKLANNLGILYAETGDARKAEAEFRRALALEPRAPDGYLNLAMLLARGNRVTEARTVLEQAKRAIPGDARLGQMLDSLR